LSTSKAGLARRDPAPGRSRFGQSASAPISSVGSRAHGTWRLTVSRGLDAQLRLPSVDATVPLSEIYENIDLVAPEGIAEASPYPAEVKVPKRS
jgi:hypothetical protein